MVWGGKRYVTNVCMYTALFRLYSGIITQTARRRESIPIDLYALPLSPNDHPTTTQVSLRTINLSRGP